MHVRSPGPASPSAERCLTDEAALTAAPEDDLRVDLLVSQGDRVAQGAPVARLRRHPEVVLTAPMPALVAAIDLGPGRRLSAIRFFHEPAIGRHRHDTSAAADPAGLRRLVQAAGLWRAFRSRPFGRMPAPRETPRAIFVMALDTRPHAPDPRQALRGAEADFAAGLDALLLLTEGTVWLCQDAGDALAPPGRERLRLQRAPALHPWGLAGYQIHRHAPALPDRPVWDIDAEDAAALGALLRGGAVPETRLVALAGDALTGARLVRCQPGADLRGLTYAHVHPGPHRILSGSALGGHPARWLGPRDRQVTALAAAPERQSPHWFLGALTRAARPLPLIPTAALEQAMGRALPVMPFLRAILSGDADTFVRLGGLSFLPEDLELVDYVTAAAPRPSRLLADLLARMAAEEGAAA